jgi:hypothetical protein
MEIGIINKVNLPEFIKGIRIADWDKYRSGRFLGRITIHYTNKCDSVDKFIKIIENVIDALLEGRKPDECHFREHNQETIFDWIKKYPVKTFAFMGSINLPTSHFIDEIDVNMLSV